MRNIVWLLLLVIPPWVAVGLDAPKWVVLLSIAPFFLFAMSLDDPDESLIGESSGTFRMGTLLVLAAGGIALGVVVLILWHVFFPHA